LRIFLSNCFINIRNSFERNRKHFGVTGRVSDIIVQYRVLPINNIYVENVSRDVELIIKGSNNGKKAFIFYLISTGLKRPSGGKLLGPLGPK
jgi:hypothetical protein